MKWAKLKNEIGNRFPKDKKNSIRECQGANHQEGRHDLEKQLKKEGEDLGVWETHRFKQNFAIREREGYEIFCCGFLYYYDQEIRNNAINHTIYFEWTDVADPIDANFSVTIYLSPPPNPNLLNGSPAAGTTDPPKPPAPPPPPMS